MVVTLMLDENSVAGSDGVRFCLNSAKKHPENPVLLPGEPHQWDSLQVAWPGTVLYSEREKKFRCWYCGLDAVQTPARWWQQGYAESEDGVHWVKPELGQVTYLDKPTNRIHFDWETLAFLSFVFENPIPQAPEEQRFCGYLSELSVNEQGIMDGRYGRKALVYSPDGIQWTRAGTAYEPPYDEKRHTDENPWQDLSQLLYEPDETNSELRVKIYSQVGWSRSWDGNNTRHIGIVHGSDFEHVENPPDPIALAPEQGIDEELHFASVKKIGDTYLMLFESDRFSKNPIHGDLRLAVSKNGLKFHRIHPQQALVTTGDRGMWDENLLVTTTYSIQNVGDEHFIYYFGSPNVYNSWPSQYAVTYERRGSMFYPSYLGLAILPRDRFAFAEGPGAIVTHELVLDEKGLWLNADGEDLAIVALDKQGKEQARGHMSEERMNKVYRKVTWDKAVPLGEVKLRIILEVGNRLYSFRLGI